VFIEETNETFAINLFEVLFGFFDSLLGVVRGSIDADLFKFVDDDLQQRERLR
jgi:hypothetical protein